MGVRIPQIWLFQPSMNFSPSLPSSPAATDTSASVRDREVVPTPFSFLNREISRRGLPGCILAPKKVFPSFYDNRRQV